jgi:hypothetical protein
VQIICTGLKIDAMNGSCGCITKRIIACWLHSWLCFPPSGENNLSLRLIKGVGGEGDSILNIILGLHMPEEL